MKSCISIAIYIGNIHQHCFFFHPHEALTASEGKLNGSIDHTDETQQAISWYNNVLGFHVRGGRGNLPLTFFVNIFFIFSKLIFLLVISSGVKFTFKNIDLKNPNEEYSFTVYHDKSTYKCKQPAYTIL